jgi:hypothetical protein
MYGKFRLNVLVMTMQWWSGSRIMMGEECMSQDQCLASGFSPRVACGNLVEDVHFA